ncbi:MAG: PLP-dependent aminotransferase family protein [Solirubrobacteraceae bacterium]
MRERARSMRPGERLPSTRALTASYRVSPVTLSRALAMLAGEGVLQTRPGSGTYVAEPSLLTATGLQTSWQTLTLADRTIDATSVAFLLQAEVEGAVSLAGGYPHPSLLPARALGAALARAARRPDAAEPPPPTGIAGLRAWFARSLRAAVSPEDVIVTGGAQAALSAAFRAIAPAGAPVLLESPTYIGAIAVARAAGLRAIPVPIDSGGVQPDLLAAAFKATGARLLYCQPTFQNPTGGVLAADRRGPILAAAREAGAFVIEDDFARWLAHERPGPAPLIADDTDGRVVHIASLTKPISPNLRVGALIARGPVAQRLAALRLVDDFFVPRTLQEAALELVSAPAWRAHRARLCAVLIERRTALLAALRSYLPEVRVSQVPAGGLHLWARLPDHVDDVQLAADARSAGVLISPGRPYFAAEPPAPHLRLSFAAVTDSRQLAEGVRRLAGVLPAGGSTPPARSTRTPGADSGLVG